MGERLKKLMRTLAVGLLGFVLGVFALYVVRVNAGPDLEVWHTADLDLEFTEARAADVTTLERYGALEAELFQQLEREVYAHTDTGQARVLARFSPGSAADPRARTPNWNRTFDLEGSGPSAGAVLLLHGLSDSPYSLRAVGQALNARGFRVVGLRIPGHGTAPSGLTRVTWQDMAAAVRLAMVDLTGQAGGAPVHVVGYSNGAALAVDYALRAAADPALVAPASLVLVSPSLGVTPLAALARWNLRIARLPGLGRLAWQHVLPEFDPYKYNSFPVNAGDQAYRITLDVASRVAARAREAPLDDLPPVLAFLSAVDATVSVDAVVNNLLRHLAPGRAELVVFDVNRRSVTSTILQSDPGPFTRRLMEDPALPFAVTLLTNANPESDSLVALVREPGAPETIAEPADMVWPSAFLSLSHVALPFPPDDPLYGAEPPRTEALYLGQIPVRGERGLLRFPADWLLRLRHNPFYDYLERRTLEWVGAPAPTPEN